MTNILVVGGVAYNTIIRVDCFPDPRPQTVCSKTYHETLGSTGAGDAANVGFDFGLRQVSVRQARPDRQAVRPPYYCSQRTSAA